MKRIIITILLAVSIDIAMAQSRMLPLNDMVASTSALSSGGSRYAADEALVYTLPSAAFEKDGSFRADYSVAIIPSDEYTQTLHTLTAAWHKGRHAVLMGGRYWLMGKQDIFVDENMKETSEPHLTIRSYAFDAGYAFALSGSFHTYATVGYVSEKALATVCAVRGTIGADYTYKGKLLGLEAKYLAGVSVANLGCYSCGDDSGSLSPRIGAGGNVGLVTGHGQNISANVDVGMYLASGNAKSETELAAGIGYTFLYNYTLRVGTHIGDNDNALTAGAAVRIGRVTVNGGVKIAAASDACNVYMVGLAADF